MATPEQRYQIYCSRGKLCQLCFFPLQLEGIDVPIVAGKNTNIYKYTYNTRYLFGLILDS